MVRRLEADEIIGLVDGTQSCLGGKTPMKTLDFKLSGDPWLVNTVMCWEGDVPRFYQEIALKL